MHIDKRQKQILKIHKTSLLPIKDQIYNNATFLEIMQK